MRCRVALVACLCLLTVPRATRAQDENDDPRIAGSAALSLSAPLGSISQFAHAGLGLDFGTGYNFTRRHAVIGEFMWNWLFATSSALQPVRDILQTTKVGGNGNLLALTAEYKYELRGRSFGSYLIGGGGYYHRSTDITKLIPSGTPIPCQQVWAWWGYPCGTTTSTTVASSSSGAVGVNGGIGFTIRVGEAPYRWYAEARYHYAPTKTITTQLLTFNIGFRY
jgi:Outer membrane protein beta-barrel domain